MPYSRAYYEDEEGNAKGPIVTWPWGKREPYSDVMSGDRAIAARRLGIYGEKEPYSDVMSRRTTPDPGYTGIYGTQPKPPESSYVPKKPTYPTLGSQPFFISSGTGGQIRSTYPG